MKMRKVSSLFFIVVLVVLLLGCSGISKEEAQAISEKFVRKNVRFFARDETDTVDLPIYTVEHKHSFENENGWAMIMHVSATLGNETKKNDVVVEVSKNGEIVSLNGKMVPHQSIT